MAEQPRTAQLELEIVTPGQMVLQADADWVTIPGTEGELGVLPEHVPLVTALDTGVLQFASQGSVKRVAVHYGYAQVQGSTVTVLAQMAEEVAAIDLDRARDAERRAREKLQELLAAQTEEDGRVEKYEAKLKRALVRLSLGD